jgi:hypothetical protein
MVGKFDNTAIQQWRSMTADALFRMNDDVESRFNEQLISSTCELEHSLDTAFPGSVRHFIGFDEHLELLDIVKRARELSFKIQHGFLSCQLVVTSADGQENSFGTHALGLDRIRLGGSDRSVIIEAESITYERLQPFFA